MNTRSLGFRIAGISLLCASALVSMPADAQVRPAYTKNVDEPGRLPYEYAIGIGPTYGCFDSAGTTCFNFQSLGNVFIFDGPPVPAGKRLIVQSISAVMPTATAANLLVGLQTVPYLGVYYLKWASAGPFFPLSSGRFGMNATLFATYGPGESPHFILYSPPTGSGLGSVSINGYLIDATN